MKTSRISEEGRKSISDSKLGDKNPMWKGNKVGMRALHEYVKNRFPRPSKCQNCNDRYPLDLANISQEYKRDVSDWEWLCRKCHMLKDGRFKNLKQYSMPKVRPVSMARNL